MRPHTLQHLVFPYPFLSYTLVPAAIPAESEGESERRDARFPSRLAEAGEPCAALWGKARDDAMTLDVSVLWSLHYDL